MKIKCIILCVACWLPLTTSAEPLSLLTFYQKAKQYDATIKSSRFENAAQQEEIDKSFAAFLPQVKLSFYEGVGTTETQRIGQPTINQNGYNSRNYSFSVRQPLYNKASFAAYGQAKASGERSKALLFKEEISLSSRVTSAYLDLLLAADNVAYSKAQKESAEAQYEQAKRKYKSEVGTVTEISEAKANLETVIAKSLEWENYLEYAKRLLENMTGVYSNASWSLNLNKMPSNVAVSSNLEELIEAAQLTNPEIVAARNEYLAASEGLKKNKSGHFPTLDLVASKTINESDTNFAIGSKFNTDAIGVQLNLPIYMGGYVSSSVRQASALTDQAREKLTETQRRVGSDVRKYFNDVLNGLARIKAYEESVKSYELSFVGTQKAYQAGLRSNVDILNAQDKLYSAKRDLAKERYQFIYNRVMLKQSVGSLSEVDIAEVSEWFTYVP